MSFEKTFDFDERIFMECTGSPDCSSFFICNHRVVSTSRAKEGPRAGFRS